MILPQRNEGPLRPKFSLDELKVGWIWTILVSSRLCVGETPMALACPFEGCKILESDWHLSSLRANAKVPEGSGICHIVQIA